MEKHVSNEKHTLLFKVERPVFTHQEEFDENFLKNVEPPVTKKGTFCPVY